MSRAPAFLGSAQHVRQFEGMLVTQNRYLPHSRLQPHSHERAFISFVIRGRYVECFGDRRISCEPGTLIFHPRGEEHSDRFESQETLLLGIEIDDPKDLDLRLFSSRHVMTGPETVVARQLARELQEPCPVSNLVVESLALELLANCCHGLGRRGTPPWLGTALEVVTDLYSCRLTLMEVARMADVHPTHLARQFRARMGCTFGEFVRRIRLARALEQLRNSPADIVDVAAATGFADQSHLTRLMRRRVGISPAAYRRQTRQ